MSTDENPDQNANEATGTPPAAEPAESRKPRPSLMKVKDRHTGEYRDAYPFEEENALADVRMRNRECPCRCPAHPDEWCDRGANHHGLGHACKLCIGMP